MIEQNILNAMLQTGVLAITIPVVLIVAWKMYTKRSLVPFWVGIMVFIAFSRMLEMIPHSLFLLSSNPVSKAINGNVVLYVIYAATVAALFEETGRYLAFRFVLTKHPNKETAVTYGIGHGGIECVLVLGVTYIQYYAYGQLINSGSMDKMLSAYKDSSQSVDALNQLITNIKGVTKMTCYMADLERISAMMVQIALSILVFQAVYVAGKKYMYWVAVALHFLTDVPAALYQKGVLKLLPTEIILFVYAALVLALGVKIYQGLKTGGTPADVQKKKNQKAFSEIANGNYKSAGAQDHKDDH
ncbi:putative chaperone [Roseburia sp. CAG:380]|jgi:uncharacterized membrane protein YhfC|uniref:YhfC family intramembrane metalloprotease n=1 Tax=Roseburia sp. AM59-24XD TaxID=2293138 RepID=UPI00033BCA90|nr:YhfC family glutamic-type intramembrane protease [Roseburia sp. AM59-24XD]RHP85278.1 YhfC family intramembrane metalloprotease [Roseburia sp. AM59-24XD]CDC93093.1 putative chaperone [Roseburia sp. CAG:380]